MTFEAIAKEPPVDLPGSDFSLAIVYNNEIRNNGTAIYCYNALCNLGIDVHHYLQNGRPIQRTSPPWDEHHFFLYIDDGRDDLGIPNLPDGDRAYWAIDTHLGWDHRWEMAQHFDYVFTAQLPAAEKMSKLGHKGAHWLPLACHPLAHPAFPVQKKLHDLTFVGFLNGDWLKCDTDRWNRVKVLDEVFDAIEKPWLGTNLFFEDMAFQFCCAKLGFNVSIKNDLNMRFFEVLSTCTCLVTNTSAPAGTGKTTPVVGIEELGFKDEEHFIGYETVPEAIEKIKFYLDEPELREQIADNGYRKVRQGHTYAHRMVEILETIGFPEYYQTPDKANPPMEIDLETT